MILVTGATGRVGSSAVRALLRQQEPVRAFVRRPAAAEDLAAAGAELVVGDFADPAGVRRALEGVRCAVLIPAALGNQVGQEADFVAAAVGAGVERIVKISITAANPDAPQLLLRNHYQGEERVKESGIPYTIIRLPFLMQTVLDWSPFIAEEGMFTTPSAPGEILALVDARDVADVIAACTGDRFAGETFMVFSAALVSFTQIAEAISAATGHHVRYVQGSREDLRRQMLRCGEPEEAVDHVAEHFEGMAYLRNTAIADMMTLPHTMTAVSDVAGHDPNSFAAFAAEFADTFRPTVS